MFHVHREIVGGISAALAECERVTVENVDFLCRHPFIPSILFADVVYHEDPKGFDNYTTIPQCLKKKIADCEDFSNWLAAEDRIKRPFERLSKTVFVRKDEWPRGKYHAVVAMYGDIPPVLRPYILEQKNHYTLVDICLAKGMREYFRQKRLRAGITQEV